MKKDSIIDYLGYILIRLAGPLLRSLPKSFSLFLGRRLGEFFYCFDSRHKAMAYANIKTVFAGKLSPSGISQLTREFYQSFGQNLAEVLLIPLIDKAYLNKYITLEGKQYIYEGLKNGKGVILLGLHQGSWELSNIICANLGFPFSLFIRPQRYPHLDKLLNSYRRQKDCRIIQRRNQTRELIQALKNNEAIGMTADQGGKSGTLVKFFGKSASMATGAVRLALKYDAALILAFYTRINGPYIKVFIEPPFEIKKSGDLEKDVRDNLQRIIDIFETYILRYPKEYLWSYKIWKYSQERTVLILSDGKTGHFRQTQAAAQILKNYLKDKDISITIHTVEIKFKNKFSQFALILSSHIAGRYCCQGCLWCLKTLLTEKTYKSIVGIKPDIVVSCGSSIAPINYVISRENLAKSIVIMRPSILSTHRFDLVVMSQHDNPPKRKNITAIEGTLNLINEDYLKEQADKLRQLSDPRYGVGAPSCQSSDFCIGLLIGGDTKNFRLGKDIILEVIKQVKAICEKYNTDILVTTSRRTSIEVEHLLKEEFSGYPRCKLLIIANEKNIAGAVPGILGLSEIIITSPESISMISEAVNSQKYALVFHAPGLRKRHKRFLEHFARNQYIHIVEPSDLSKKVEKIWSDKPQIHSLRDNFLVAEAIKRIL